MKNITHCPLAIGPIVLSPSAAHLHICAEIPEDFSHFRFRPRDQFLLITERNNCFTYRITPIGSS